jgi:hypothetical protein
MLRKGSNARCKVAIRQHGVNLFTDCGQGRAGFGCGERRARIYELRRQRLSRRANQPLDRALLLEASLTQLTYGLTALYGFRCVHFGGLELQPIQ